MISPIQRVGAPTNESRHGRGANNQRLNVSDSEPASFAVPIVARKPDAHETVDQTRDCEAGQRVSRCGQTPGCLPTGYDLDSLLTPEQFCIWQQASKEWFKAHSATLPGVIARSERMVRVHPRTYLELSLKGSR